MPRRVSVVRIAQGTNSPSPAPGSRVIVCGTISSAQFATGDRLVIGRWPESPIGPMFDVMWASPDDARTLLAPNQATADFITAIYDFDDVRILPFEVTGDDRHTVVSGEHIDIEMSGGRRWPIPFRRPLWMTRWIERPIAKALMGVNTHGVSPTGAVEWYQASGCRWLTTASAGIDGRDLGELRRITRPVGVGFSEPPPRPSLVSVRVTIDLPPATRS